MIEEKNILDFMKSKEYIPMKAKELASIFDIHKNEIDELKNILKKLENEGKIKKKVKIYLYQRKTLTEQKTILK